MRDPVGFTSFHPDNRQPCNTMAVREQSRRHLTGVPHHDYSDSRNPPARSMPKSSAAIIAEIAAGVHDGELDRIAGVISERLTLLRTARSMSVMAALNVGDRVRINHTARPAYLHGAYGHVVGWAGQRVIVRLDQPAGRSGAREIRCPPLVLEPA